MVSTYVETKTVETIRQEESQYYLKSPRNTKRRHFWYLNPEKVIKTVRTGKILDKKCTSPNKLCFAHYFGKENITYTVVVKYYKEFIRVETAWPKNGR